MAFLMYAARKLQLISEINSKTYELHLITQQYQDAQEKVAEAKEAQAAAKNQVSVFAANAVQQAQYAAEQGFQQTYDATGKTEAEKMQAYQYAMQQGTQAGQFMATIVSSIANNIFDAQNKAEMAKLNGQESYLALQKENLEMQLQTLRAEKESVDGAAKDSVKEVTPTFGLG